MIQELFSTIRSLWRSKLFSLLMLAAFTFGIASTATVFSVIDAIVLRPAGFPDPSSMVLIQASYQNQEFDNITTAYFDRLRAHTDLFAQVAAARTSLFTVTRVPSPDQMFGMSVSGNYFGLLATKPLKGRLLNSQDDKPGEPPVVLLSYKAWQRLLNQDPNVEGKAVQLDGDLYTVIGVMPANFVLPNPDSGSLLWTTLLLTPAELSANESRRLKVIARLLPSTSLAAVQRSLDILAAGDHDHLRLRASAVKDETDPRQKLTLWLAMGMVSGLLLIGCANLASILLARSIARRRDFAIRLATGASRSQLIRQTLTEILLLAFAALGLACIVADTAMQMIRDRLTTIGAGIPGLVHVQLNADSLLFSFAIALLCAVLCGLFPAIATTNIDLASGLRESGTSSDGRRSAHRFLHSLLAVEAGISLLLLLTSGLLVRSFSRMLSEDHGLRPDHVLTMRLPTGAWQGLSKRKTPEQQQQLISKYLDLLHAVQDAPNVQVAALASSLPLSHVSVRTAFATPSREQLLAITQVVTPDYFRVMGIPLLSGKTFPLGSVNSKLRYLIVNQAFVQKYFDGQDAVGKFLLSEGGKENSQIIGVVKNSPHRDLTEAIEPEMYGDFQQTSLMPFLTGLVVRTQGNPNALVSQLRDRLALKNADQAIVQVKTLQTLIDENVWQPRFSAWLASTFAAMALLMCGLGIYGVVAYTAAGRQRDFGIRVALGAKPAHLLRLAASHSLTPVLIGSLFGLLGFYWTSKWIAALLYKTSPLDPLNAGVATLTLLMISLAAVARPALRAARVDPAITLRHE